MKTCRLFCLPHAGGSSLMIYNKWKKFFASSIDIIPVELAGRGRRINEPHYNDFQDAVNDIYSKIKDLLDLPYAFFGHSLGSVLAYEVTKKIISCGHSQPFHIFFSGRYPPHIKKEKNIHDMPKDDLVNEILRLGGTSPEISKDEGLLRIFLPILRSDYRILENYRHASNGDIFTFDISTLNGKEDNDISPSEVEAWKEYTSGNCSIYYFEGGHFYLNLEENQKKIFEIINRVFSESIDFC